MNTTTLLGVRKAKVHKYMCRFYDAVYDLCSILQQLDYTTVLHYNTAPTLSTNINLHLPKYQNTFFTKPRLRWIIVTRLLAPYVST